MAEEEEYKEEDMKKVRLDPAVLGRLQHLRHDLGEELGVSEQQMTVGGACTYCNFNCTATCATAQCRTACDATCASSCVDICMSYRKNAIP